MVAMAFTFSWCTKLPANNEVRVPRPVWGWGSTAKRTASDVYGFGHLDNRSMTVCRLHEAVENWATFCPQSRQSPVIGANSVNVPLFKLFGPR
jgi:hypothetical protein